jgi:hypothetical protein
MRLLCAVAGAALLACSVSSLGETKAACDQTLTAPLQPRAILSIESRPAGLQIVGTDQETIHVTCTVGNRGDYGSGIVLRFLPSAVGGKLEIEGSHRHSNNLQVRIEVPRRTNLRVRMSAGEVNVQDVAGDKDVELYAGQIRISSEHEWDYRKVDASVAIGQVRATMYGADKGGFFRSVVKHRADGEYRLHAHVTTGEIDLLGKKTRATNERKPD